MPPNYSLVGKLVTNIYLLVCTWQMRGKRMGRENDVLATDLHAADQSFAHSLFVTRGAEEEAQPNRQLRYDVRPGQSSSAGRQGYTL